MKLRAPTWLGKRAKKKWGELGEQLPSLTTNDADALALLCQSWQSYLDAQDTIVKHGQVVISGDRLYVNPAINVSNEAWKQIVKLSKGFGLTPDLSGNDRSTASSPLKDLIEER